MTLKLKTFPYRLADHVMNGKMTVKKEIESILRNPGIDVSTMSRPNFNRAVRSRFVEKGWNPRERVFDDPGSPAVRLDFLKERVGVKICTSHSTFIGSDLFRFQLASYSNSNKVDVGVYIVTTRRFQKHMLANHEETWEGSLTYENVTRYLPYFRNEIQVPIYVIGIDI